MKHHIFLSYSRKDLDLMRRLRADLESLGFTVWTDEGIDPGTPLWDEAIENALKNAGCMVVILTPNAIDARGLRREIHFAEIHEVHIIPVLARGDAKTSIPFSLSGIQWTDIRTDYTAGLLSLYTAVNKHVNGSQPPNTNIQQNIRDITGGTIIGQQINVYKTPPEPVGALNLTPASPAPTRKSQPPQIRLADVSKILPPPFEWCEIPAGKVTLEKGGYLKESTTFDVDTFFMAKYPITNAQLARFIEADGYQDRDLWTDAGWELLEKNGWSQPCYWQDEQFNQSDHPVVGVSWYEAHAFCRWINAILGSRVFVEGETITHSMLNSRLIEKTGVTGPITLPTEQQWQRAAQGDDNRTYPWGNDFDKSRCNTEESGIKHTTPVTQYPNGASPYGVMDMIGNVWEWCLTSWDNGSTDARGTDVRLVRGGSWYLNPRIARAASRDYVNPNPRYFNQGFRVVATPTTKL